MRRTILQFCLIALGALLAFGCDRGDQTVAFGGNANGLVGDEASAGDAEILPDDGDEPSPPLLGVTWTDGAEAAYTSSVSFEVTNTTEATIAFSVALHADSLVGEAEKPVAEGSLGAGESADYSIPAAELPVLSSAIVGNLSVRIRRTESLPGGEREVVEDLATRFYEHTAGYGAVRAFGEATLRDLHDGVIVSLSAPTSKTSDSAASDPVGEVWNGAAYTEKTKEDSGLYLRDADGNVYGVVNEVRLASEVLTDLPEPPPDEGDVVETEVGDE